MADHSGVPTVLVGARVDKFEKVDGEWVRDPNAPRRLQGTVGDEHPGVEPGQTGTFTSSPPSAVLFETTNPNTGSKRLVRIAAPVRPEDLPGFLDLVRDLLTQAPAAAQGPEAVAGPGGEGQEPLRKVEAGGEGATGAAAGQDDAEVRLGEEVLLREPTDADGPKTPVWPREPVTPGPAKRGTGVPAGTEEPPAE
jgi:hypothetical protein